MTSAERATRGPKASPTPKRTQSPCESGGLHCIPKTKRWVCSAPDCGDGARERSETACYARPNSRLRQTGQVAQDAMSSFGCGAEGTEECVLVHIRGGRTQRRSVTGMMRLSSAAQQRRVNVVTCTLVLRHKASSQEGVMNLHLCFVPRLLAYSTKQSVKMSESKRKTRRDDPMDVDAPTESRKEKARKANKAQEMATRVNQVSGVKC